MRSIGFSTGAIARGDFWEALRLLDLFTAATCIELSALRLHEVEVLARAIPRMDLSRYQYVSVHAPSSYSAAEEPWLVSLLDKSLPKAWPIILHPDAICNPSLWRSLGSRVAIENMDRRKSIGRTATELTQTFELLPAARFCFDIGHARQWDTSMLESFYILNSFASRLVQVHISEVNSESQHDPLSYGSKLAFRSVASLIPNYVPLIIESRVAANEIASEVQSVLEALPADATREVCRAQA
jgi:hypothetical protein